MIITFSPSIVSLPQMRTRYGLSIELQLLRQGIQDLTEFEPFLYSFSSFNNTSLFLYNSFVGCLDIGDCLRHTLPLRQTWGFDRYKQYCHLHGHVFQHQC